MNPAPAPRQAEAQPARVLVCDDSATMRGAIARILQADPQIRVVATVATGQAALDALRLYDVDVVVLDLDMPVMDGMTALPLLLKAQPGLQVVIASSLTTRGAGVSMQALRLGAADYVPKPTAVQIAGDTRFGPELVAKIHGLTRLRRGTAPAADFRPAPAAGEPKLRPAPAQAPLLLAIGSSTGGPNALFRLVQSLSPRMPVPVVITQHMPASFTSLLAENLDRLGVLRCREAEEGTILRPGEMVLARGDTHLLIKRDKSVLTTSLSHAAPENYCRPAVDPMLRSAAAALEGRVLVVMLTGMGSDGLEGTRKVVDMGGAAIAQDEETSVVWGMPGAIARAGLAHAILPLARIGPRILSMVGVGQVAGRSAPP